MIILFDIDETLVDQSRSENVAATQLWEELDFSQSYTLPEFLNEWDVVKNQSIKRYLKGEISFAEQRRERIRHFYPGQELEDQTLDSYFEIYREEFEASWTLFPDVLSCLNRLSDFRMGIISNGDSQQQRRKLRKTQISDHFERVVISGDSGISKPNKEIFIEACSLMQAKPSECLYIGDNYETDFKGSTSAGMKSVLIDRKNQESPIPEFTIVSLSEMNEERVNQSAHTTPAIAPR